MGKGKGKCNMALWVKVKVTWLYGKGKGNMAFWVKVKVTWLSG